MLQRKGMLKEDIILGVLCTLKREESALVSVYSGVSASGVVGRLYKRLCCVHRDYSIFVRLLVVMKGMFEANIILDVIRMLKRDRSALNEVIL